MRMLFTTFAARTHLYSMVPLAWAAKAAGHEVRVVVHPSLVQHATGAGLAAVAAGHDVEIELPSQQDADARPFGNIDFAAFNDDATSYDDLLGMFTVLVPTYVAAANDSLLEDLVDVARSWQPDLVVWEPMTWAGAIAARACGAAHARLLWGPDVLGDALVRLDRRLADVPPAHREHPLLEWMLWSAERVGADVDAGALLGDWTIEVEAPPFRLATGLDVVECGYVPYNGPAVAPSWLDEPAEGPLVCVTLGMSSREGSNQDALDVVALVRGLRPVPARFVVTMSPEQAAALGAPPPNVRVVDFVALDLLLPSCAAIVHHGGAGTWSTALRHAVPQVIVAHTWDAPLKARMLDAEGAGIAVEPGATHDDLAAAIVRAIEDVGMRERAVELAATARAMPTPAQAVLELERRVAAATDR